MDKLLFLFSNTILVNNFSGTFLFAITVSISSVTVQIKPWILVDNVISTFFYNSGLTNPPSVPSRPQEVPYPVHPIDYRGFAAYKVNWTGPIFTGGLSYASLRYSVTVSVPFGDSDTLSTSTNSLVVNIDPTDYVRITVAVINPAINSSNWQDHPHSIPRVFSPLGSTCKDKGIYIK